MLRNFTSILKYVARKNLCFNSNLHTTSVAFNKMVEAVNCDGVLEIKMNQPKTRNALSMAMMEALLAEFEQANCDKNLRCVVLSAEGKVWSAGHNLKELAAASENTQTEIFAKLSAIIYAIYKLPVPVIAKVDGLATAAGCQLASSCDMLICSKSSTFSTPGSNVGIFCSTPGIAISRLLPRSKSAYMLMTGLPITAEEAYIAGLVSRVAPDDKLNCTMEEIINSIKLKSRAVIALGKKFYYEQMQLPLVEAYNAGAKKMSENLNIPDGREGLQSFIEKRKPKWKHE